MSRTGGRRTTDPRQKLTAGDMRAGRRGRRRGGRANRRRALSPILVASAAVAVATAGAVLALFAYGRWGSSASQPQASGSFAAERLSVQVNATGRLLVPFNGGLQLASLPSGNLGEVVPARRSGAVTSARWSPDGRSVAYAIEHVRAGEATVNSEIHITNMVDEPQVAIAHGGPGSAVELPSWTPDGGSIYFASSALEGQLLVRRVERLDLAAGTRSLVTEGVLPDLSADGARMAFVRPGLDGDTLLVSMPDGQGASVLIPPDNARFGMLGAPRFSPDGYTLAIPARLPPSVQIPSPPRPSGLLDLLGVFPAYAHGDPWDVYLVDVKGGEPRRLTHLMEDEMGIAWSPDGTALGIYSSRGLHLVDLNGHATQLLSRGGFGGIDWSR